MSSSSALSVSSRTFVLHFQTASCMTVLYTEDGEATGCLSVDAASDDHDDDGDGDGGNADMQRSQDV